MPNSLDFYNFINEGMNKIGNINTNNWWSNLKTPYNNWDTNKEGIMEMYKSEEAIDYMTGKLIEISSIIEQYFKKPNL